jgi:lipid-A-disaccharide synthase
MKIYMIAGEASGDLHGSNLVKAVRAVRPDAEIRAWGGDLMAEAGAEVVKHYRDLAFMGFIEVVMNLRTIMRNLDFCKADIRAWQPDVVVFIDYPGFNLRIAEWAHAQGIRTFYYISPQIWAWKENRVHAIRRTIDRMCVVLPFEQEFYARHDMNVEFVGHPLLDAISEHRETPEIFRTRHGLDRRPVIALLPGSRKQEIRTMLPLMCSAIAEFPDYQFVVAAAPSQDAGFYESILSSLSLRPAIVQDDTYGLLAAAHAGLVTSGTATLEAGLFGMPQVVCYRGSAISYHIARRLVKIKYISLVNLILDRPAVTELIQSDLNPARISAELRRITGASPGRERMLADYSELRTALGGPGASMRTASLLLKSPETPKSEPIPGS